MRVLTDSNPSFRELAKSIEDAVVEALRRAVIYLPPDVKEALRRAYMEKDNEAAKA